jgi:hypothetical protein
MADINCAFLLNQAAYYRRQAAQISDPEKSTLFREVAEAFEREAMRGADSEARPKATPEEPDLIEKGSGRKTVGGGPMPPGQLKPEP